MGAARLVNETRTKWDQDRDWDRDQKSVMRPVQSIAGESNTTRYVSFFITHDVNGEPEMDFAFKMI